MTKRRILCAAISMLALSTAMAAPAYAKNNEQVIYSGKTYMAVAGTAKRTATAHKHRWAKATHRSGRLAYRSRHRSVSYRVAGGAVTELPHPAGCPRVAFCGCGAAVEVFGRPVRNLWLARNWYAFRRDAPAPGNVAVRPHHVFVLRQNMGGGMWLVADHNGGHRRSWLHVRSLAGYSIVNPHSGRYASL